MAITRRKFLTIVGGAATGAVVFQACGVPEDELLVQSPVEMPEDLVTGTDNWYATVCRQCSTPEGLVVRVMEGRARKIEGNVDYPINRGSHSARCEAGLQGLYHPDRIRGPLVRLGDRGSGEFEEISWTDAIGRLAFQLQNLQESNRESAMVLATKPLGGHAGMVADRFASKLGGRRMSYEPLERTTLNAAIMDVFGQSVMPDFDIENASYVLSFGADFLNTWVSPVRYSRGYGEFRQGDRTRGKLVHIDSRFSMTCANADEWFYVKPGAEGLLALSIAHVMISEGWGDGVAPLATGGGNARLDAFAPSLVAGRISDAAPAEETADRIRKIAHDFAESDSALAIGGGSAGAHTNGLFNLSAIYSLNHMVGNVGRPGGVLFNPESPLEGIPAARSPSSFDDWRRLVQEMNEGGVQVLMIHGADPWHGLPEAAGFRRASFNVPFIFSLSGMMDDTTAMSDLILPIHHYLEDWGTDVPNPGPGYQTVGFQQPVVRPFFESRQVHLGTRNFADTLMAVAERMELELDLPGESFKEIVEDGARQLFESGARFGPGIGLQVVLALGAATRRMVGHIVETDRCGHETACAPGGGDGGAVLGPGGIRQLPPGALRLISGGRRRRVPALAAGDSRPDHDRNVADVGRDQRQEGRSDGHRRGRRGAADVEQRQHRGDSLPSPGDAAGCGLCPGRPGTPRQRSLRQG